MAPPPHRHGNCGSSLRSRGKRQRIVGLKLGFDYTDFTPHQYIEPPSAHDSADELRVRTIGVMV
jgi:hypothetical protein